MQSSLETNQPCSHTIYTENQSILIFLCSILYSESYSAMDPFDIKNAAVNWDPE